MGITSDMVIPNYPNTHPDDRTTPIQTKTPFPFSNCYHWINSKTMVRIRRQDLEYDNCTAVKTTAAHHVEIGYGFSADFDRIRALKQTKLDPVPEDSDGSASGADAH